VASDKIAHNVEVTIEASRANFNRRYGAEPKEVLEVIRRITEPKTVEENELESTCPACESEGVKTGYYHIEWDYEDVGQVPRLGGTVWFVPETFTCRVCGLRLDSTPELTAARMGGWLEIEGADPYDYAGADPYGNEPLLDEDSFYEAWRESREEGRPQQ
jgi:rubredoxin